MNESSLCRAAANGTAASARALSALVPPNCSAPVSVAEEPFFTSHPEFVVEFSKLLYGLVCLVGLCGNSLVIYVVLRFSKMQTVTNMYIFNLALADEMFLVGLPFFIATMVFKYWPFGAAMCKVYMTTTSINQFTSSLLLTVMSADRYVAVCHPISSPRYRTPFIAKFVCLTAWTVSALLMVPVYMYASVVDAGPVKSCTIVWPESAVMNGQAAFTLYSFTLGFAIPLLLILLFYVLVILRLSRVGPRSRHRAKHRKVTYLVLTVITVYVICWLPYWAGQLYILGAAQATALTVTVFLLSQLLSYANSAVNPILYAFLSDNFKKSFAKAFTCAAVAGAHGSGRGREQPQEDSLFPRSSAAPGGPGTQAGASKVSTHHTSPSSSASSATTKLALFQISHQNAKKY
ncbi:hypothetical protein HPB48_003221 [Haemaphysalis longicornis]|uniref:G-protein coupled receptors family 1 profile domain-containing protein n=1 Tax=Haemaphysalis longicornis TaxID=44386 RepID=A0A9J6FRH1_HAELO|nr:hypothetical protein HPB48_003221 [Haemaphysalis longicornis]